MKDLSIARMINVVAAGSILTVGTGCGSVESRAAKRACQAQEKCAKGDFEDEWGSMEDCVEDVEEYLEYYSDEYGEACGEAFAEFVICQANVYSDSCDLDEAYDECEDEYENVYDECYSDSSGPTEGGS